MDHSFSYAILQAQPDVFRGERVNVGLIVFKPDGLDIQIFETRKIRALTGVSWDQTIKSFSEMIDAIDDSSLSKESRINNLSIISGGLIASTCGWFKASNQEQYAKQVREIACASIIRPKSKNRPKSDPSIVSEISAELRRAEVLADRSEALSSGKVVRNFEIDGGLEADFAQRNSRLHVAAVLDLRAAHPQLAQAALKAVVLDRAQAVYGDVHKIGVYAVAPARYAEVSENIALLKQYADDVVNWEDRSDREGLKRVFFDAFNSHMDHVQTVR